MTPVSSSLWSAHDISVSRGRSVGDVAGCGHGRGGQRQVDARPGARHGAWLAFARSRRRHHPLLDRSSPVLPTHSLAAPHGELIREGRYAALRAVAGDVVATRRAAPCWSRRSPPSWRAAPRGTSWSRRWPPPRSAWCTLDGDPACSPPAVGARSAAGRPPPRRRGRPAVGHRRRTPLRRRTAPRPPARPRPDRATTPTAPAARPKALRRPRAAHRPRRRPHPRTAARPGRCAPSATGRRSTRAARCSGSGSTPCCSIWTACSWTPRRRSRGRGAGGRPSTTCRPRRCRRTTASPRRRSSSGSWGRSASRRASRGSSRSRSTTPPPSKRCRARGTSSRACPSTAGRRHLGHPTDRHGPPAHGGLPLPPHPRRRPTTCRGASPTPRPTSSPHNAWGSRRALPGGGGRPGGHRLGHGGGLPGARGHGHGARRRARRRRAHGGRARPRDGARRPTTACG